MNNLNIIIISTTNKNKYITQKVIHTFKNDQDHSKKYMTLTHDVFFENYS